MGSLLAINVPVDSHAQKLAILFLGPIAWIGLAVMSVGRLTKVDSDGGASATPRIGDP